jgi:7-cyano-7-deazaguanine synthase in queuosine biosynthesis
MMSCSTSEQTILCFSTGLDSFVTWFEAGFPECVYFSANHKYQEKELEALKNLQKMLCLSTDKNPQEGTRLFIDKTLDFRKWEHGKNAHIFHRNLMFSAVASGYKLLEKSPTSLVILLAGILGDTVEDKNPKAFQLFSEVLTQTSRIPVEVRSLFWNMTKTQIVKKFLETDYPAIPGHLMPLTRADKIMALKATISCYDPTPSLKCGTCGSCFRRAVSLVLNDIEDDFAEDPFRSLLAKEYLHKFRKGGYPRERVQETLDAMVKASAITPPEAEEILENHHKNQTS